MRGEIVASDAALAALEPAWWGLWRRVAAASPFSTPAWLLPWWQVFAPGDLFTVAIWHADRLVALAPLYRESGASARRLLPLGISLSDYADVLIDPAVPEAAAEIVEALQESSGAWDVWSAEELPPEAALLRLWCPAGWSSSIALQSACPVLDLGHALAAVPALKRRKWRMAQNRTQRRAWSLDAADAGSLAAGLDALFQLHGARWAAREQAGVLADADVQWFHRLSAPRLLAAGLLRLVLLRIDGMVAGAYYGFRTGDCAYAYLGGFDPAFAFESPGTVLLGAEIEAAATLGVASLHLLRGQEPYKYEWGAVDRWNSRRLFEPVR